ncbi:hypothetical protein J6590_001155 [Homalodisca vitripennis]|nr:hypothetical protein J6590_001155 [Homalodisca vitripennis]
MHDNAALRIGNICIAIAMSVAIPNKNLSLLRREIPMKSASIPFFNDYSGEHLRIKMNDDRTEATCVERLLVRSRWRDEGPGKCESGSRAAKAA